MNHRVDPIRIETPIFGARRRKVMTDYDEALSRLQRLDAVIVELSRRRREALDEVEVLHRRLWTNLSGRGRRPLPDGTEALPPAPHDARTLWGRRLRSVCLGLLRIHGAPMRLVDLHALLHRRGFVVASSHPVKALADALGYERIEGRVRRTARGIYELVPGPLPARGRHGRPIELAA